MRMHLHTLEREDVWAFETCGAQFRQLPGMRKPPVWGLRRLCNPIEPAYGKESGID